MICWRLKDRLHSGPDNSFERESSFAPRVSPRAFRRHPPREDDDHIKYSWTYFWGAHQRFFKELCVQIKVCPRRRRAHAHINRVRTNRHARPPPCAPPIVQVPEAIAQAKAALAEGKCVVIGLQGTGEARSAEAVLRKGVDEVRRRVSRRALEERAGTQGARRERQARRGRPVVRG